MFTYLNDTHPNLIILDLAISVKHILLPDVCNGCQKAENSDTQKKILMYQILPKLPGVTS